MTEQQTAATDNALVEKLCETTTYGDDYRNPDGPEAAERIKSLLAEVDELRVQLAQTIMQQDEEWQQAKVDRQRMREALLRIRRGKYDGREVEHYTAYECRLIAMEAVALNPASKEANDARLAE